MIQRLLARIAKHFTDTDWLYERRRQEVLSRRESQRVQREINRQPTNFIADRLRGVHDDNG